MSKAKCDIRIGTSGWYYDHWKKRFYPPGLPKSKWFEHYAKTFNTVEINNTFYRLPKPQSFAKWYDQTPKNFVFVVKANRYITHIKRLKNTYNEVGRFYDAAGQLAHKLGVVLFQLPPSLRIDLDLLKSFIKLLPQEPAAVFEFRHKSWYVGDTFELLCKLRAGFCIHDMPGNESPKSIVSDIIYIRFHGSTGKYSGSYSKSDLQGWAKWLKDYKHEAIRAYAFFNNDISAHAIDNAKTLREQF